MALLYTGDCFTHQLYAAVLPLVASLDLLLGAFTLVYLGARALTLGMRARGAAWIVTGATT